MKKPFVAGISALLLLAVGNLLSARTAMADDAKAAEEAKPVITVAFAGYDAMLNNVKTVSELAGRPEWVQVIQGGIALATQGRGLKGLDKSRPWGVMVFAGEGDDWPVQAFVPVTDIKPLMKLIPAGGEPLAPDDDGVYEIPVGGKSFYAAQKGKWARLTESKDTLKTAVEDPMPHIGALAKKYLVAVRISVKNIPEATREKYLPLIRFAFDQAIRQQEPNESEEQAAARAASGKQAFEQLERMSKELEDFTYGLGIDPVTNAVFLDMEGHFVPGSKLAQQSEALKDLTTRFAGFLAPHAAVTGSFTADIAEEQQKYYKGVLAFYKASALKRLEDRDDISKEQQAAAKDFIDEVFAVLKKSTMMKKLDGAIKVDLGDKPVLVAGAAMADGLKLESTIKHFLGEVGKDHPEISDMVKLDVEKYEGVNFHLATLPIKDEEAAKVFGKTTELAIGINDTTIYLAAGKGAIAAIKKVIDDSAKDAHKPCLPMQANFSLAPIASFIAEHGQDDSTKEQFKKFADEITKSPGKDHVTLTVGPAPNGSSGRLTIESGVIKAIGAAVPGGADSN